MSLAVEATAQAVPLVGDGEVPHLELNAKEIKAVKREEKEDYLREHECDCCRFIPCCKPKRENHGVSFFCQPAFMPHSHKNYFFHSVFFYESLGEIGYHFLDYHRNFFFGFATILSMLGVITLLIGAVALVPDATVVKNTYWSTTSYYNKTAGVDMSVSVGLQALVYAKCQKKPGRRLLDNEADGVNAFDYDLISDVPTSLRYERMLASGPPGTECEDVLLRFDNNAGCKATGIFDSVCQTCGDIATSIDTGVFFSAFGKFVGLFSMQKRMYGYADSPSLKFIGMCTELVGFISMVVTLLKFDRSCTMAMSQQFTGKNYPGYKFTTRPGPGTICFVIGAIAGFIRFWLHFLTPLPHRGKGICVPVGKALCRMLKCAGCCVLYDDAKEDAEREAKHQAAHANDPARTNGATPGAASYCCVWGGGASTSTADNHQAGVSSTTPVVSSTTPVTASSEFEFSDRHMDGQ